MRKASLVPMLLIGALTLAGCDGSEPDAESAEGPVEVVGTDGLAFDPAELTVGSGEVTIELTSEPAAPHTFTIEELGDVEVVAADGGETATGTVELEPGTYTYYCSIPGHREAGMEGTLTVE